jgi:hypothetical protein
MALIAGYGGAVTLNFQSSSAVAFPVRNIAINFERSSIDTTQLSDFREKRAPGRVRRTATFDMMAQDSTTDSALRLHMFPTTLAEAVGRSVALSFTDQGAISYTITGHLTSASRSDDGTGPGMWSLTLEEA